MSEWEETTLGDVVQVVGGGTPSTKEPSYWGGTILWLTPTELTKREGQVITSTERTISCKGLAHSSAKIVPKDTVLLTSRATVGAVGLAGRPMATNQGFQSLIAGDRVLPEFLMRWVQNNREEFEKRASGSTFPEISGKKVKAIPLVLPPLSEQRRIVEVVSSMDAQTGALEAEYAALNLLYTNALSLLWIDESTGQAELCRLSDLMTLDVDRVKVDETSTYPIAGVLNAGKGLISRGAILGSGTDYVTLNKMRAGQVVMRKLTAWEGPISVVPDEFDGYFASAEFPTFSLTPGLSARYFEHVCRTQRLLDEMKNRVTGTVQRRKRLNPDQLLDVQLPVPPLPRQAIVADALDAMYDGLALLTAELAALRRVRSDVLTALLSQDITVDEAVGQFAEGAA